MPYEGPGERFDATATKQVNHGDPSVEVNHAGVAAKNQQTPPMFPTPANIAAAQLIAVGEEFTIMMDGLHEVSTSLLPGGAAVGSRLFIAAADNTLHLAADALTSGVLNTGFSKFGVVDAIDHIPGKSLVNLEQRGSF